MVSTYTHKLKNDLMRELALGKAERRLQVFCQVLRLLNRLYNRLVYLLLVRCLGLGECGLGLGLALLKELSFSGLLPGRGLLGKVGVVEFFGDLMGTILVNSLPQSTF